jgi:hypothetical protein
MRAATRRKRAAGSRSLLLATASLLACGVTPAEDDPGPSDPDPPEAASEASHEVELAALLRHEETKRAGLDHARARPWSRRAGAEPIALLPEEDGGALGLLRSGRVVRLDAQARELGTGETLAGATDLLRVNGDLLVVAEGDGRIDVLDPVSLAHRRTIAVEGVASIRAAAHGHEGRLYLTDPHRHRVLAIDWPSATTPAVPTTVADCGGALDVSRVGPWLVHSCLLDHEVVVRRVAEDGTLGAPSAVRHDGPIWSFDARLGDDGGLRLLLGGVEDRPLDREGGAFGYVDSFAFVVEVDPAPSGDAPTVRALGSTNVSALGVVTPKHVAWRGEDDDAPEAIVTGYGDEGLAILRWPHGLSAPAEAHVVPVVPGIAALVAQPGDPLRFLAADPLLDAWVVHDGTTLRVHRAGEPDDRTASERLGEALAFTTLMAPGGTSEGRMSRFTCETCHFEGRVDGRVHFTGRADVHATTKTLRGLFPNRPHFSRALDRTTAKMVHGEFTVVSRGTGHDPWFSIAVPEDAPWLSHLGVQGGELDPLMLRRALVDFLAIFTPEPNPAVRGVTSMSDDARAGAELFLAHCESCHAARLVADEPASRVPFEAWAPLVLSESGPIVWGQDGRVRTGVEPYVHPDGARVPSLRRLWDERPYLTHGRARTLEAVLEGVRLDVAPPHEGTHEGAHRAAHGGPSTSDGRPATAEETRALRAFLDLL